MATAEEQGLPRDNNGFPYYVSEFGAWRVTECCGAAVTYYDTTLCCKGCYDEVDSAYESPAVLDGNEPVITAPTVFRLKKEE